MKMLYKRFMKVSELLNDVYNRAAVTYLCFVCFATVGSILLRRLCGWFVDGLSTGISIAQLCVLVVGAILVWFLSVMSVNQSHIYEYQLYSRLYNRLYRSVLHTTELELLRLKNGEVETLFINDTNSIQRFGQRFFSTTIPGCIGALISIVILYHIHWVIATSSLISIALTSLITHQFSPLMHTSNERYRNEAKNVNGVATRHMYNIDFIKTALLEDLVMEEEKASLKSLQCAMKKKNLISSLCSIPLTASAFITILTIGFIGGYLTIIKEITSGQLISCIMLCNSIVDPLMSISQTWMMYKQALISSMSIKEFEKLAKENNSGHDYGNIASIAFNRVEFWYPNRKQVFDKFNLKIKPGKLFFLIGKNGSGKSTLMKLLMRLYDPHDGNILINDFDSLCWNIKALRSHVAFVCQEPIVINDGVFANIGGDSISAWSYAMRLGLTDEVNRLPDGFNTQLTWDGKPLSRGQIQRLQLIRALSEEKDVYVFDEPTSAIDQSKSADLNSILHDLAADKIVIVITHDMSLIQIGDKVVFMDNAEG